VDKSLIVANRSGPATRYRLLETVREYAALLLVGSAAETSARVGVTRWAIDLMDAAEPGLEGPEQATWLAVLDAEHDNLLGLLDWAVSHTEPSDGLQIAASMWRYWEMRGLLSEGRSYLERLLGVGADRSCAVRAKALASAGVLAQNQADLGAARGFYQEALEMHGSLGDDLGVATALNGLGTVAVGDNDLLGARTLFEQNLGTSRRLADERMIAASLMNLGVVLQLLLASGRIDRREGADQAEGCYRESLELYRGLGNRHGVASALENLGVVAPYRDDYEGAQALLEESLVLRRDLQDRSGIAASARFLGHLALRTRQFDHARRLHQECLSIERELGNPYLMAADLVSLAEIAEAEGDGPEAHELLERALALYQGLGDRAAAKRVAEGQGRVARFERHTPVGDPRRPEHAPALATAEPDAGDARLPAQAMYSPRRR
jgi:tetratricopeptide (TPR) repeat protein